MESIYDYPLYYDILYGWDRDLEARFYHSAFAHHGLAPGGRILELCCGTGQIGLRLAGMGWQLTGLDIRSPMLEFMEQRAHESDLTVHLMEGDMRNFASFLFDGVYCPANSFRLLHQYDEMQAHLRSVANNLRPGGVYVLDMYFSLESQVGGEMEEWTQRRDEIEVASLGDRIVVDDPRAGKQLTLDWGGNLRRYTFREFMEIFARSGGFELESCHPVQSKTRDNVDIFSIDHTAEAPEGHTMVILKRVADED